MSTLLWITLSLFVSAFVILSFYVRGEDKEADQPVSSILLTTGGLSLLLTAIFAVVMLIPFGLRLIAKSFVSFDQTVIGILFFGAIVILYVILLDHLLHLFIRKTVKQHPVHYLLFNGMRFFIFIGVSSFVAFPTSTAILIALTGTAIFFILDIIEDLAVRKEQPH